MKTRLIALRTGVLGLIFWGVLALIVLGGGYWLSDQIYAVGLWPIGAVMRLILLGAMFWFAWVIFVDVILRLIDGLIHGDQWDREFERILNREPQSP